MVFAIHILCIKPHDADVLLALLIRLWSALHACSLGIVTLYVVRVHSQVSSEDEFRVNPIVSLKFLLKSKIQL